LSNQAAISRYVAEATIEPESIARARNRAVELGAMPVSAAIGAQLALLAAASGAKSILEIGTGGGVSALHLLRGARNATITTIDVEPEYVSAARASFADAGIVAARSRFITGRAIDVLPRMNEGDYDIVLVDADVEHVIEYVEHGLRLVRKGGLVLVPRVLSGGKVADPVQRDDATTAYRTLIQETAESPAVVASLSATAEGLLQMVSK
jgi:predicted O-methyltransferase YrrM